MIRFSVRHVKRAAKLLLIVILLVSAQKQCRADFVFAFNTSGTNQDFLVGAGAIVNVPVYLVQTDGENRLSSIGLFSSGASVSYSYGSGAPQSATVNSATLAAHWNDPVSNLIDYQTNRVVMEGLVDDYAFPALATSNAVLLGTVHFQAGELGNVTNLQLSLAGVTPLANSLVNLVEVTPITFRIGTIAAVPEPNSLCLIAAVGTLGLFRRSRRKPPNGRLRLGRDSAHFL